MKYKLSNCFILLTKMDSKKKLSGAENRKRKSERDAATKKDAKNAAKFFVKRKFIDQFKW